MAKGTSSIFKGLYFQRPIYHKRRDHETEKSYFPVLFALIWIILIVLTVKNRVPSDLPSP